jgi:hypothetical protein
MKIYLIFYERPQTFPYSVEHISTKIRNAIFEYIQITSAPNNIAILCTVNGMHLYSGGAWLDSRLDGWLT